MDSTEFDVLMRSVLVGVLGYVVGAEHEYIAHGGAGTSTFGLVSLAAMVTALSFLVFDTSGASRIVANVLVGVGFLGGGMIVKDIVYVRGLTTAAGMWARASAGIVIGADCFRTQEHQRHGGALECSVGHAAGHQACDSAPTVSSHDNQIRSFLSGDVRNRDDALPPLNPSSHVQPTGA